MSFSVLKNDQLLTYRINQNLLFVLFYRKIRLRLQPYMHEREKEKEEAGRLLSKVFFFGVLYGSTFKLKY